MSGLPVWMNSKVRNGAWPVFKKIVELDCRRHHRPDAVEITLGELSERCGVEWEKLAKVLNALLKKKYLACFIPDNPDEVGLFQIRIPVATPKSAAEVAQTSADPYLRDVSGFRYLTEPEQNPDEVEKIQKVVDLYLNTLSQKVNSFIVDQIEVLARRFPLEEIEKTIARAARHEIRSIGWVAKELIRDASREKKAKSAKL